MTTSDTEPSAPDSTVVGIGASAGGLGALKRLFASIPEKTGLAWVVVVHLSPDHESYLAELLQPHAQIPIQQVSDTTPLEPDHVYVIPPGRNISTIDTHLRLDPLEADRRERAPIDHFFRTLSETHGTQAIAVVLTGTGSDGSLGLRCVKEKGGLTIAQDPNEAQFDGMPQSAIATGFVDLVLPIDGMVPAILRYDRTEPRVPVPAEGQDLDPSGRQALQTLLALVRTRTGRDFARYKRSTILRRIRRRMQLQHVEELESYIDLLRDDQDEVRALADEFLITVTSFFRDARVFRMLESDIVPKLFQEKGPNDRIRVWSVGCATGEESYSIAMLLLEEAHRRERAPQLQIFASDLHEHSLEMARAGYYPQTIEGDVSPERLRRFFVEENGRYRVRHEVRELVVFAPHNLLGDPPFSQLDLIACRNVLIYLQRDVQSEVVQLFHYALRPGGYLLLGTSETVERGDLFRVVDKDNCVYQRGLGAPAEPHLPVFPLALARRSSLPEPRPVEQPGGYGALHQILVERYAPPSILVSGEHDVVHISENAGRYLHVPGGAVTSNVFKVIREELRIELRAALHAASDRGESTRSRPVRMSIDGVPRDVVLRVHHAREPERAGYALVMFDETAEPQPAPEPSADDAAVRALEAELAVTKQRMQAIIEEYETSQEEMRASNEELQSANEELRSTMEELETSKEELQSLNEELATLNQENRHKVEELSLLTSDLHNLLTSTEIATLFLDRKLRILRFTPRVSELFNVRSTDRGRPLSDLTHRFGGEDLLEDAREVLARLSPVERELRSEDGRWFLARVLPYRTMEDRIEGIVMTFVDVTPLKSAQDELRETEQSLALALDAAEMGTFDLDLDTGVVRRRNARHDQLFGYAALQPRWDLEFTRRHVLPEDRPRFDAEFAAARGAAKFDLEVRVRWPDDSVHWLHLIGRTYVEAPGRPVRMLGVVWEITSQKETEAELIAWAHTLEARVAERTQDVRELAARLARAEHEERRRISHILHDDLQQLLYAAHMRLEMAGEELAAGSSEECARALDRVKEMLTTAVDVARRLTVDLSPPVLRGEGLTESLQWLATQMQSLHGLTVELRSEGPVRIADAGIRVMLFQIVRELLFNVVKHAGVHRATVSVEDRDGRTAIEVADGGLGFEQNGEDGFGLESTREHVALLGGELSVESAPGRGTRVIVHVPSDLGQAGPD